MAAAGVEIGSHGYTHADLGPVSDTAVLRFELASARTDLQAAVRRPVRYFAFPFGQFANLSARAFALAEQAGYEAVCSGYGGLNFPGDDPFHLQRIAVSEDMIHLKNWTTDDPRKRKLPRFVYRPVGMQTTPEAASEVAVQG
jgi:peptidoglycan/xylan/chitin deacetylase (PgdA/CDA1 family)